MAEPLLSYTLDDYQNEIAYFIGKGLLYSGLSTANQEQVNRIITFAQNKFYTPIDYSSGAPKPYKWSFMDIPTPFTLTAGVNFIVSPTFMNYLVSSIQFNPQASSSPQWSEIKIVNYADLLGMQNPEDALTGPPQFAAMTLATYDAVLEGPRWIMQFYPVPDDAYQIIVMQSVVPSKLANSGDNYQAAGYFHCETFMLCCKMVAAERFRSRDEYAERRQEYEARLQMSIQMDKEAKGGVYFGHMGNNPRSEWNGYKVGNPNRRYNGWPFWAPPNADYINTLG